MYFQIFPVTSFESKEFFIHSEAKRPPVLSGYINGNWAQQELVGVQRDVGEFPAVAEHDVSWKVRSMVPAPTMVCQGARLVTDIKISSCRVLESLSSIKRERKVIWALNQFEKEGGNHNLGWVPFLQSFGAQKIKTFLGLVVGRA